MKAGWKSIFLGDVCTLQRGFDLPVGDRRAGVFPLVSSSGIIDTHDEAPVSGPGVVTGRSGSIGDVFFVEDAFWPLNTTLYVRDFHGNDPRFIYYLLVAFDLKKYSGGTGVPTLNRNDVHSELVHVPISITEQRRIVTILDEAFEAIATAKANAERNLRNARELFESHLQAIFSEASDVVALSEIASDITDGDHMPPPKAESGIPFITISNIVKRTRTIDFSDTFLVSPEYFAKLKYNRKPRLGDVLYTVTGATLGIPVLVDNEVNFCFQRHIALIRPKPGIDSAWLNYAMLSPQVFKQATDGATGTAQKTVSLSVLRGINVPALSMTEQIATSKRLDDLAAETYKLEDIYVAKLAALDELKKSLLHRAFTGQL